MSKINKNPKHSFSESELHYQDLPIVNCEDIGADKPKQLKIKDSSVLPNADIALLTWTSDEWCAFDDVFRNSDKT